MRRFALPLFTAATILLTLASAQADTEQQKLGEMAATLAANLARVCPRAPYGDTAAFNSCAAALKQATFLPFADAILWGGDQTDLPIKKRHLTHFNPKVFQGMYLPLMTFTGKWSIGHDDRENFDIIRLEAYFRNELPAGEYPYPFWHSADKWNAYETMNQVNFYLNAKGEIFVGTRGDKGDNDSKGAYTHVTHAPFKKGQWLWTDATGKRQPEVALFTARYEAANPHMSRLDQTYRAFATEMRKASCDGCHNPANPQNADWLTLLQTPNHAAGEIDRVIKQVEDGAMPQDDIGLRKEIDPKLRAAILRTAQAFRNELAAADEWETSRTTADTVAYSTDPNAFRTR